MSYRLQKKADIDWNAVGGWAKENAVPLGAAAFLALIMGSIGKRIGGAGLGLGLGLAGAGAGYAGGRWLERQPVFADWMQRYLGIGKFREDNMKRNKAGMQTALDNVTKDSYRNNPDMADTAAGMSLDKLKSWGDTPNQSLPEGMAHAKAAPLRGNYSRWWKPAFMEQKAWQKDYDKWAENVEKNIAWNKAQRTRYRDLFKRDPELQFQYQYPIEE